MKLTLESVPRRMTCSRISYVRWHE